MTIKLSPRSVAFLVAMSGCDERTVRRWAKGEAVRDATVHRIRAAAAVLKIELEPTESTEA